MAKPQQAELRRSGAVPALDPDATEAVLSAQDDPKTTRPRGPVPEEQRPGHRPSTDQDKPDLEKFAARLGIASEGDEPDDAPHVERSVPTSSDERSAPPLPLTLLLLGPAVTYVGVRGVYRTIKRVVGHRR